MLFLMTFHVWQIWKLKMKSYAFFQVISGVSVDIEAEAIMLFLMLFLMTVQMWASVLKLKLIFQVWAVLK